MQTAALQKTLRVIEPSVIPMAVGETVYRQKLVAAYCRVSTKQEEQLNSYEMQMKIYTEKINAEPKWKLVGIYADKGISGTSVKNRDEFNRMIRDCKRHKIQMIITKSISRFARNTLDCLKYVRLLRELGVDVYFEEQGLHSMDTGAEFYITIYGSIAQTESENISANVRWGKEQSIKHGNVIFQYKNFLGYHRGEDGNPEIVPEEAEIVRRIYREFLSGRSFGAIGAGLTADGIQTPRGKDRWMNSTIQSILTNEKYKGDALLQKTYIEDCISKKVKKNNGVRTQYYVENNHPAIIDGDTFNKVQEEMKRRIGKRAASAKGKTPRGKYSGKYALTELLICGNCGSVYRRCTWTHHGLNRKVWRCLNRMENGTRYCKDSPTIDEEILQNAIMEAVLSTAQLNADVLKTLKTHIEMGLDFGSDIETEDRSVDIRFRMNEIDKEFGKLLSGVTAENQASLMDDPRLENLMAEKRSLEKELLQVESDEKKRTDRRTRLGEILTIVNGLKNHPLYYDDQLIRQLLECVVVESAERIKVVFAGGFETEVELHNEKV